MNLGDTMYNNSIYLKLLLHEQYNIECPSFVYVDFVILEENCRAQRIVGIGITQCGS